MEQKIEFRKQRDFGETINDTFMFVKQNFKSLFKTYFIYCGFFVITSVISTVILKLQIADGGGYQGNPRLTLDLIFSFGYFLSILSTLLLQAALSTSIISYIKIYVEKGNETPTNEEVWGYFKYYFLRVFGSTFVLILLLGVAFVCCIFPGIWLFPIMAVFFPIMICENGTFGYAFNKMFKVVSGNWWTIFAIVLVIWFVVGVGASVFSFPALIIEMGSVFGRASAISTPLTILSATIQGIGQVFTILPVICATFCYYSEVEKKESSGLFHRINHFGQQDQDKDNTTGEY